LILALLFFWEALLEEGDEEEIMLMPG